MSELARALWDARRLGHTIEAASHVLPKTLADAYATQEAIIALSGLGRRGYKVGSTSKEAQRLLGTDEPGAGVLLAPYVHESPASVALVAAHHAAVEGEFAFRMRRDLPPRAAAYGREEVTAAIGDVAGAIEVVGTRFSGGLGGKGRLLTTADGGVNIALVVGPWTTFEGQDLREHAVAMRLNAVAVGSGTGSRALGNPIEVMVWLANHLSGRGLTLSSGDIVSTGTCTGLDRVATGDIAEADFGTLGRVTIAFE